MSAVTNQPAIAEAIEAAQANAPLNASLKGEIEAISKSIDKAGQAVCGIAQVLQADLISRSSGDDSELLNDFTKGCLLSGLELLSQVLWDRGEELERIAAEGRGL